MPFSPGSTPGERRTTKRHPLPTLAAVLAVSLLMPGSARAAESYDNCSGFIDSIPATITTQGVWCLRADLSTAISSGNAITIATNNVTLDCNDFKLGGLAAGPATGARGVYSSDRLNSVVRNCNIRGFYGGVFHQDGSGHVVEDSRFEANRFIGIQFNSPNSTARRNFVLDTGGIEFDAYGIVSGPDGGEVVDNVINGVTTTGDARSVFGIWYYGQTEGSIGNNRIRGLAGTANTTAYGIYGIAGANGVIIHDNILHGPASPGSTGIRCITNKDTAARNLIRGFITPVLNCLQSDNVINAN